MLWQSRFAELVFSNTLWPDYSFWDLLQALVQYQRSYPELQKIRQATTSPSKVVSDTGNGCKVEHWDNTAQSGGHLEAGFSKGGCDRVSVVSTADATDVDTSDSSASSESRPASPACLSRSNSPPRVLPELVLQHHSVLHGPHDGGGYDADCQPTSKHQQLQHTADAACCTESNDHEEESCQQQRSGGQKQLLDQSSVQHNVHATALFKHGKHEPHSKMLHAEADCRQWLPDSISRRKPYMLHADSVD